MAVIRPKMGVEKVYADRSKDILQLHIFTVQATQLQGICLFGHKLTSRKICQIVRE